MQLYEATKTRSARCRWLLQELNVPFEGIKVQLSQGEHKKPEFLKINPYGRVPVLVDGDLVLSESIAICLYLADKYADKKLIPPPGTPERAKHDQWLLFCATELELLAAVKKRGKPADIDDGKRPSIMVNKKGAR